MPASRQVTVGGRSHSTKAHAMTGGLYVATGNVFVVLNMLDTPTRHVPIRMNAVEALQESHFSRPAERITISILQDGLTIVPRKGALFTRRGDAIVFAIARDVKAGDTERALVRHNREAILEDEDRDAEACYWATLLGEATTLLVILKGAEEGDGGSWQ